MSIISQRSQKIEVSASLAIASRIMELQNQGKKIINLAIGEPDFDTPQHIKIAAIKALKDGFTKYTATDGIMPLKEAICAKFQRENALRYIPDEVLVSCGAKHSFYNLCQAMLDHGDEVVIPAPYWVSYPEIVKLAAAEPVILKTSFADDFKVKPEQLEEIISPQTKMFILNSPSNPTGMVYSEEELTAIAKVLLRHPQVLIVSDDIYEHIIWNHMPFTNILNCCADLKERTIVINGVSKTYAMTGWRIGYAAGNNKIISAMKKIQSQSVSCPTSIAQAAALAALNGDQTYITHMSQTYKERHDFLIANLQRISALKLLPADGAFYLFVDISASMRQFNFETDTKFVTFLLQRAGVAVLPGSNFGVDEHMRISYASSMENIALAVESLLDL